MLPKSRIVLFKYDEWIKFDLQEWKTAHRLILEEITTRPNPGDRVEHWEYRNHKTELDLDLKEKLLKFRKSKTSTRVKPVINKRALNQLCDRFRVDRMFGEHFLNEIKLTTDELHKTHREVAKLLELL